MERLKQLIGNFKILFVKQAGSNLFMSDGGDVDYLVVVENWNKQFCPYHIDGVDYFCFSQSYFEKFATLQLDKMQEIFALCLALGSTAYGTNPLLFYDWFNYKTQAVKSVLKWFDGYLNGRVFCKNGGQRVCSKRLWWAFATYFAIVNNSAQLTDEQCLVLRACHDKLLPLDKGAELKQKLMQLIEPKTQQ